MEKRTWLSRVKDIASGRFTRFDFIADSVNYATANDDDPPEEEHAVALVSETEDQELYPYVMRIVRERLRRAKNWTVAVKTLAVIHRLAMDARHPSFGELESQYNYHIRELNAMSQFEDRSSPLAMECVAWVRAYSCYLSQRLVCNRFFMFDIVVESQNTRKIEDLEIEKVLLYLPSLQRVLGCLLDCTPQGSQVAMNSLIQHALLLIVRECPNVYAAINACIGKLVDSFFGMPKEKALMVLGIYQESIRQTDRLPFFYDTCSAVLSGGGSYFPPLTDKPTKSLALRMWDYIDNCTEES
jgi:hypothetical protein